MAIDDKRVLIVDCDLHRPSVHNLLNVTRDVGFTNVVLGTHTLEQAIMSTDYPGLDFLPAGTLPPNPSEVLNSRPRANCLNAWPACTNGHPGLPALCEVERRTGDFDHCGWSTAAGLHESYAETRLAICAGA